MTIQVGDKVTVPDRYGRPVETEILAKLYDIRNRQNKYRVMIAGAVVNVSESDITKESPHVSDRKSKEQLDGMA